MRQHRSARLLAAALVTAVVVATPARVLSDEATGRSWLLEHFGDDVTILRLGGRDARASSGAGLMLSCDGLERRLRITLPDAGIERLGHARSGSVLIRRGPPEPGDVGVIAPFTVADDRILAVSEHAAGVSGQTVLAVARILEGRPERLDLLIHAGARPVSLSRLFAYHLPVPTGPRDVLAVREFIAVCAARGAARATGGKPASPR